MGILSDWCDGKGLQEIFKLGHPHLLPCALEESLCGTKHLFFAFLFFLSHLQPDYNVTFPKVFMSFPSPTADGTEVSHSMIVLVDQILCLMVLMFMIMAVLDSTNNHNSPSILPIGLLFILAASIIGFGYNAGAAINPARDLPARAFMSALG